jgi:hypothetical protein
MKLGLIDPLSLMVMSNLQTHTHTHAHTRTRTHKRVQRLILSQLVPIDLWQARIGSFFYFGSSLSPSDQPNRASLVHS